MIQESKEPVNLFDSHKQLKDIIDTNHPLVQLADSIDWESIEKELSKAYPSTTGHPNKPIRLMVGLHYLRYMFDLSDESIVWAYIENPLLYGIPSNKIFAGFEKIVGATCDVISILLFTELRNWFALTIKIAVFAFLILCIIPPNNISHISFKKHALFITNFNSMFLG